MEELALLFNADFEGHLSSGKLNQVASSKTNQEFEYLIHWLNPERVIFSSKTYDENFQSYLQANTGNRLKTRNSGQIEYFCQDYSEAPLKKKLASKFETMDFLMRLGIAPIESQYLRSVSELPSEGILKAPFGVSGSGHFKWPADKTKVEKVIKKWGRILWEPEFRRSRDFSTLIENNELSATYENYVDESFQYKGSYFSPHNVIPENMQEDYNLAVEKIQAYSSDYSGIMSIDGFLYNNDQDLYPCCEINVRKTMGYCAQKIFEKYFPSADHYKFLLFKNKFSSSLLESFYKRNTESALMLSPPFNKFCSFAIAAESEIELKRVEKELVSTLFNSF